MTVVSNRVSAITTKVAQRVNIASCTVDNRFTVPSDGYAYFQGGATETILSINSIGMCSGTTNTGRQVCYVKAGMVLHFEGTTPSWAYYQPIV